MQKHQNTYHILFLIDSDLALKIEHSKNAAEAYTQKHLSAKSLGRSHNQYNSIWEW